MTTTLRIQCLNVDTTDPDRLGATRTDAGQGPEVTWVVLAEWPPVSGRRPDAV